MGFLANLIGGAGAAGAGQIVKDTGQAVGSLAKDIRTAITGVDPDKAAELEKLALELDRTVMSAQAKVNEIEAASPRFFVAGWRPGLGWVFVLVIALHYLIRPIAQWIVLSLGSPLTLPSFELAEIWPVLIGLLGLGTLRTVEKAQGSQHRH
jgi:hypothetical protein